MEEKNILFGFITKVISNFEQTIYYQIIQKVKDVINNFVKTTLDFLWMPSNVPVLTTQMLSKIYLYFWHIYVTDWAVTSMSRIVSH